MSSVTLEEAKKHLRVEHSEEDALIQTYIEAAEDWIAKRCGTFDELPKALVAAVLLFVGDLYENREIQFTSIKMSTSKTMETLVAPYRRVDL
jgi:uncharacterized phage protein (predicted DNA packaging)|nr:MAG TPA: Head Tail Connector Protein [Caudoviricetes sp.]